MTTNRLEEADAFTAVAHEMPVDALAMAQGWTAHDLLIHVVVGGAEMARLVLCQLNGDPVPTTISTDEREPESRALPYEQLAELLGGTTLIDAAADMPRADADATLPFTGWEMTANELRTRVRGELALHRWDMVGTDDVSVSLLGQPELTAHAIKSLTNFDVIGERLAERTRRSDMNPLDARLCVDCQPDVRIFEGSSQRVELIKANDEQVIVTTAADRLLMLWGRRPCPSPPPRSELEPGSLTDTLAWIYA